MDYQFHKISPSAPSMDPASPYFGWNPFCIPLKEKYCFDHISYHWASRRPFLGFFEAPFELQEPNFHSASIWGTTFEGSLKTFLRDLDEVGE